MASVRILLSCRIHVSKLTWQYMAMENGPGLKMYFLLLKSGGFSSLPCLPEGTVNGRRIRDGSHSTLKSKQNHIIDRYSRLIGRLG